MPPAVFTVLNANDAGPGSLRQAAVDAAAGGSGADAIVFDATFFAAPRTITLASTIGLANDDGLEIRGPGAANVTIAKANGSRAFTVNAGGARLLSGFTLQGGGIDIAANTELKDLILTGCQSASGGAVFVISANLAVTGCAITNNIANLTGGGIQIEGAAGANATGLLIQSSTLSGNTSQIFGAGVYARAMGSIAVVNSTLSGNFAGDTGGGLAAPFLRGGILVRNSTVTLNRALGGNANPGSGGGGIAVLTTDTMTPPANKLLWLQSSIVSGNVSMNGFTDLSCANQGMMKAFVLAERSAIGSSAGFNLQPGSINAIPYGLALNLGPLADNGGPTQTHALLPGSPAIDAGVNPAALTTDQRGPNFVRVFGAAADIGAYERIPQATFTVVNAAAGGPGSLRQAVLDANANPGPNAIAFDADFFNVPRAITLAQSLDIADSLTVNGPGANLLTVSGGNAVRVVNIVSPATITVALSGLRVTGGRTTGANEGGAGIFAGDESVTLDGVAVDGNAALGAMASGGGVAATGTGRLTVRASTISGNTAGFLGGGLAFAGGGSGGNLLLEDSTVAGNTALFGGGLSVSGAFLPNKLVVRNSTISGNTATLSGGGLVFTDFQSAASIQNCTITANAANDPSTEGASGGGGLAVFSAVVNPAVALASTIVSGNSAANGRGDLATGLGVTALATFSAIGDPDGFVLAAGSGNNLAFGAPLDLGPLVNNGGRTATHALGPASAARDAGANPAGLTADQRGGNFLRVVGSAADVGAFEGTTLQANYTVTNADDSGPGSLRQAILDANATAGTADTITFDPTVFATPRTISLTAQLAITDGVTIAGPGANLLTVSGSNAVRVFSISGPGTTVVRISDLRAADGFSNADGAGVFVDTNEVVTLERVRVENNVSTTVAATGGGIRVRDGGRLTVRASTIANNRCEFRGGGGIAVGLTNNTNLQLVVEDSTISGNECGGAGGGGAAIFAAGTFLPNGFVLRNSTISDNTGVGQVGGIHLVSVVGTVAVQNCTVTANTTATGAGGIDATGGGAAIQLASTIVSGNTGAGGTDDLRVATPNTVTANFSAIGDSDGFALEPDSGNNLPSGANVALGPLADNGGPTRTRALGANSAALNAGANPATLANDQRGPGFARVVGPAADIGALEQGFTITVPVTNTGDSGPGSLRQAILDAANNLNAPDAIALDPVAFATPQTVALQSPLEIGSDVTVIGPAGAALTFVGRLAVSAGAVQFNVPVTTTDFGLLGGSVGSTAAFTIDGPATWTGGALAGTATATVTELGTLALAGTADKAASRPLVVNGTLSHTGGDLDIGAALAVGAAGAFVADGGTALTGGGTVRSAGSFVKTSAAGATRAVPGFETNGRLQVDGELEFAAAVVQRRDPAGDPLAPEPTALLGPGGILRAPALTLTAGLLGGNGTVQAAVGGAGSVSPGESPGNITVGGGITLQGPLFLELQGPTRGTDYDTMTVLGAVNLAGPLRPGATFDAPAGAQFLIVENDGTDPVAGTFTDLPEGATVTAQGYAFTVSYVGGTGNDVVLTRTAAAVAPPRVTAVQPNGGDDDLVQRSRVTSLAVTFDREVTFADPNDLFGAFALARTGGGPVESFFATAATVGGVTVVTLTGFSGAATEFGSLADGRYVLTVRASEVLGLDGNGDGASGDDFVLTGSAANGLYRLYGDLTGDGFVNAADFGQFRGAFGTSLGQPGYREFLDFNGDGFVNAADFGQFRTRFGSPVP